MGTENAVRLTFVMELGSDPRLADVPTFDISQDYCSHV